MKNYSIIQLRDYSTLFSRREVLSWQKNDFSSVNLKINRYDKKWLKGPNNSYLDYLKYVYSVLLTNYQNEYIVKNEFLKDWLIKELGESSTKVFSEFRIGNSIADLVMFNGNSKIFEIKTELDSATRLSAQLCNYKKVFNQIYLIVPKTKINQYEKLDYNIGLITYEIESLNNFKLHRNAINNTEIVTSSFMEILHTNEYKSIVNQHYGYLPEMNSFNQYCICSKLINLIPLETLNKYFVNEIKKRNSSDALSIKYYREFNQLFLALKMSKSSKKKMIESLKTQIQI